MTPNKEDYLKELYKLGGSNHLVSNKQMAQVLGITPASVTEMLNKLGKEGLLTITPYKGSQLTKEGLKIAFSLLRGHRLWEVFFIRHLGYTWSEAHEDAELLEHISPARLTDRLDRFLNYPAYCPHGSVIPKSDGQMEEVSLISIADLKVGETSQIRQVLEEKDFLDYLQDQGIEIGSQVTVISIGAYEGPFTLSLEEKIIQISYKAACQIFVSEI
ncbi:DtxR family iron (metal) dependent repressor [Mobilisporobacter senegalensis]|uniref:Manganese transport regulator n=1 Tax=Mobilisporobacter senegalensis TaxID=1329262 RepID=A0A3N1XB24_9FIRM|nr:metal-dependent transcriptional regulator [Mobilisporobacter senegalensis]ROR23964.1 DtxR family iron (metal) dependent repressor [Mobilisporobacter senegalensis]